MTWEGSSLSLSKVILLNFLTGLWLSLLLSQAITQASFKIEIRHKVWYLTTMKLNQKSVAKKFGKFTNMWGKLDNISLTNQWGKKEITGKIRKHFKMNEVENNMPKLMGCS